MKRFPRARAAGLAAALWSPAALSLAGGRGTSTGQFLKLAPGARAAALGEAVTAWPEGAASSFWNPAGPALLEGRQAELTHLDQLGEISSEHLAFLSASSGAAWGASAQFTSAGEIVERDEAGVALGTFAPRDSALSVGAAWLWEGWPAGISAKWIRSKIAASDSTLALDAGFLSPPLWEGRARAGVSVLNLGGRLAFDGEAAPLPTTLRLGARADLVDGLAGSADLVLPRDGGSYPCLGVEARRGAAALRAGWSGRASRGLGGLTGLSLGFGLVVGRFRIDYALVPFGDLGLSHRLSAGVRLGAMPDPRPAPVAVPPAPAESTAPPPPAPTITPSVPASEVPVPAAPAPMSPSPSEAPSSPSAEPAPRAEPAPPPPAASPVEPAPPAPSGPAPVPAEDSPPLIPLPG